MLQEVGTLVKLSVALDAGLVIVSQRFHRENYGTRALSCNNRCSSEERIQTPMHAFAVAPVTQSPQAAQRCSSNQGCSIFDNNDVGLLSSYLKEATVNLLPGGTVARP